MKIPIVNMKIFPLIRERQLAITISLPYCNFKCPWCYASRVVIPKKITFLEDIDLANKMKRYTDRFQIKWALITGGEPTLHPKALHKIFSICLDQGIKCILDTNLTNPNVINSLIKCGFLEYIHCDVKAPLDSVEKYSELCGLDLRSMKLHLENITKSLRLLVDSSVKVEIRTTVVPALLSTSDILKIVDDLLNLGVDFNRDTYVLEQFTPPPVPLSERYAYEKETPKNYLDTIARLIKDTYQVKVHVRLMHRFFRDISSSTNIIRDFINGRLDFSAWEYVIA